MADDTYHTTVSKMARKYSQYKLPSASELGDSDDDALGSDADTPIVDESNNINLPNNSNNNADPNTTIEPQQKSESPIVHNDDTVSESGTVLSHKSLRAKKIPKINSKNSLLSASTKKVHFDIAATYSPMAELREIQTDKQFFMEIFDKYFDESKEGDVDFDEFKNGLHKLEIDLNTEQIEKLFDVLRLNGGDNDEQYIDRDQFSDFLTRRFEAPQLLEFQDRLLKVIMEKTKKNSARHRLLSASEAEHWDTAEVSLAEIEMRQAMEQMVDNEMEKITRVQEFNEELERRSSDPAFCQNANAEHWDCYEVAHWVQNRGYEYAIKRFFDQQIDGNVLLYDINSAMLVNQLGINQLHANKFMRSLSELKEEIFSKKAKNKIGELKISENLNEFHINSEVEQKRQIIEEQHNKKLNEYEQKINESTEKLLNLQRELNKCEEKFLKSQQEIVQLNVNTNELKENVSKLSKENAQKVSEYESLQNKYDAMVEKLEQEIKEKLEWQSKANANNNNDNNNNDNHKGDIDIDSHKGPLYDLQNQNEYNPYLHKLDLDVSATPTKPPAILKKVTSSGPMDSNFGSLSLTNYVNTLQKKADEDKENFAKKTEANKWTCEEVAYWLSSIGMKKYLVQFVEQFVDGQILLNDITSKNLISDLDVKSLHAPKIMRELNKLKKQNPSKTNSDSEHSTLDIVHEVNHFAFIDMYKKKESQRILNELQVQNDSLKADLSEARLLAQRFMAELQEREQFTPQPQNKRTLSSQSSMYDIANNDDNQSVTSNITIGTTKSANNNHLRHESNITAKTAFSEGNDRDAQAQLKQLQANSPTPPLPTNEISSEWSKYVTHIETKNRDLSQLFLRADRTLRKYVKAVEPIQERVHYLEGVAAQRKESIIKLNKRVGRRDETIKRLKHELTMLQSNVPMIDSQPMQLHGNETKHVNMNSNMSMNMNRNNATMLSPEQEMFFHQQQRNYALQQQQHQHPQQSQHSPPQHLVGGSFKPHHHHSNSNILTSNTQRTAMSMKKKNQKRRGNMILANDSVTSQPHITGYLSRSSNGSIRSEPSPEKNESLFDKLYGYIGFGSATNLQTPGN